MEIKLPEGISGEQVLAFLIGLPVGAVICKRMCPVVSDWLAGREADYHPGISPKGRSLRSIKLDRSKVSRKQPWELATVEKRGFGRDRGFSDEEWYLMDTMPEATSVGYDEIADRTGMSEDEVVEICTRLVNRGFLEPIGRGFMKSWAQRETDYTLENNANYHPGVSPKGRSSRSWSSDMSKRSRQPWERGRQARKIGNPRYKPVQLHGKKQYVLRDGGPYSHLHNANYHPGVPMKGRSARSINADRRQVSKQPWEQSYTRVKHADYHPGVPMKGRSARSINADRRQVSKQPWEQSYTRVKHADYHPGVSPYGRSKRSWNQDRRQVSKQPWEQYYQKKKAEKQGVLGAIFGNEVNANYHPGVSPKGRSSRSWSSDMSKRSRQPWERGRGARRIGNPRYKPVMRKGVKRYVLRK